MSYMYQPAFDSLANNLQKEKYKQFASNLLKAAMLSSNKIVVREANEASTEILHEVGITDRSIGDVTLEIMITTQGKIPNEMYYFEETTYGKAMQGIVSSTEYQEEEEKSGHSLLLLILLIALLVILLFSCFTACFIARSRKRSSFFGGSGDCDQECGGINQPLLGLGKVTECNSKTSDSCMKH